MCRNNQNSKKMRTNNNNTFSVENLVAKYRNFVKANCAQREVEETIGEDKFVFTIYEKDDADEQMLITLYKSVAGGSADKNIVEALAKYASDFYTDALNEEEMMFLVEHFSEVSSYIWGNPYKDSMCESRYRVQKQVVEQVRENVTYKPGMTIYIAESGYCDVAILFPGCTIKGYTNFQKDTKVWALGQIRLYAAGIKSEICVAQENAMGSKYLADVDYMICGSIVQRMSASNAFRTRTNSEFLSSEEVGLFFRETKETCKLLWILPICDAAEHVKEVADFESSVLNINGRSVLSKGAYQEGVNLVGTFRKKLVENNYIDTIISFEFSLDTIAEVVSETVKCLCINASKATHDYVLFRNVMSGEKMTVPAQNINPCILWQSYYMTPKPKDGILLSEIVSLCDLRTKEISGISQEEIEFDDPDENFFATCISGDARKISVVNSKDLGTEYANANLSEAALNLAGDMSSDRLSALRKLEQPCVLLWGTKEKFVAGYVNKLPADGLATNDAVVCLVPKEGIDVRYVAALLLSPEVKNQISSICDGEVWVHPFSYVFDKIVVPNHTELERAEFLSEANYNALLSSRKEMKQEHECYIKAIRMRKHALTQSASSISATLYALNAYRERQQGTISDDERISRVKKTTVKDAFEYLSKATKDMLVKLDHIADVDYSFAEPEWVNPEEFIEQYVKDHENSWINFRPLLTWENGHNLVKEDLRDSVSGEVRIKKGTPVHTLLFPKDALTQVFDNIISNAQSHGFNDGSRSDYQLRFSWKTDGLSLTICIENNGTPLPSDRTPDSLLEYGVSTSLNTDGHHGIGCNEIEGIMRKYDGEIELVSSPEEDFKVKYLLTFNRTNSLRGINSL